MDKQPAMKEMVHTALTIKAAFLVAKVLQVLQLGPEIAGSLDAQLAEHAGSLVFVRKGTRPATGLEKKRSHLGPKKFSDNIVGTVTCAQTGSDCQPPTGSRGGRDGPLLLPNRTEVTFEGGREIGNNLFCLFQQLHAHRVDLLVDRFQLDAFRHQTGDKVLQDGAQESTDYDDDK